MTDCEVFDDMGEAAECTDEVAALLCVLAHGYCVESGTFRGKSAKALAVGAERVDTVDPCPECWTKRGPLPSNVHAHKCRGIDFTPVGLIDLLFIDSGLDCRIDDLLHLSLWLRSSGLVVLDDAHLFPDLGTFRCTTLFTTGNGTILARRA